MAKRTSLVLEVAWALKGWAIQHLHFGFGTGAGQKWCPDLEQVQFFERPDFGHPLYSAIKLSKLIEKKCLIPDIIFNDKRHFGLLT